MGVRLATVSGVHLGKRRFYRRLLDRLGIVRVPQEEVTLHPFLLGRKFQKAADKAVLRKNGVVGQKNTNTGK